MITAVCMKLQHPPHICVCTIFMQMSLSSKWRWARHHLIWHFSTKKKFVEREIMLRTWIQIKSQSCQNVAFWQFRNKRSLNFFFETTYFLHLKLNFYWRKYKNVIWANVTLPLFVLIQSLKLSKFFIYLFLFFLRNSKIFSH